MSDYATILGLPQDVTTALRYLNDIAERNGLSLEELIAVIKTPLAAQPSKLFDGQLAYADGTNWNPGYGKGLYQYVTNAWQPISANTRTGHCRVKRTSDLSFTDTGNYLVIPFEAADYQTSGMWVVGDPTVVTIPRAGIYHITGAIYYRPTDTSWEWGSAEKIVLEIMHNAAVRGMFHAMLTQGSEENYIQVSCSVSCAAGDEIEMQMWSSEVGTIDAVRVYGGDNRSTVWMCVDFAGVA